MKSGESKLISNFPMIQWIANSKASDHIVLEKNIFINHSILEGPHRVTMVGGGTLLVQGVGNVHLEHIGTLKGALHVQGL